ncbi:MAG TPA: lipoate--protein ligase family protein [Candidatus Paceibacterota bacterium]|nr:lipoate--protein ligase family protein [Verrucomicrobiota bacterium]HSA00096.1 lipoate--protein ligase family protein [Candidatus Paceibacterota bacterium]
MDLNPTDAAQSLALEEVIQQLCEAGECRGLIWFWEPRDYAIILGYSRPLHSDVLLPECQRCSVPVFRRSSGGGTVLQGAGCLNYSLVLRSEPGDPWDSITRANHTIMNRHRAALQELLQQPIEVAGITDLVLDGRKFSGNAQRRLQRSLLFHGSFLLNLDLSMVTRLLPVPSNQPAYRGNRCHDEFLVNLGVSPTALRLKLCQSWNVGPGSLDLPWDHIRELAREKYSNPDWTGRF